MSTTKLSGDLQLELREALEADGWIVRKAVQFSTSGWPDMEAFKRPMKIFYIEVKRPGETLRKLQAWRRAQLKHAGFHHYMISESSQINPMIAEINYILDIKVWPVLTPEELKWIGQPEPEIPAQ